jgi:hypothetical protein
MTEFYNFDFTCGMFTSGYGDIEIWKETNARSRVIDELEKNGEKNCNVVFKKKYFTKYGSSTDFNYHVESRWTDKILSVGLVTVVPYVGNYLVSKFEKQ